MRSREGSHVFQKQSKVGKEATQKHRNHRNDILV